MLLKAAEEHGVALHQSLLIGDQESDIVAGKSAGLLRCALFSADEESTETVADDVLHSHLDAVRWLRTWVPRK
jgi:D-glycero-D-manno-heptose 1,7-bisphosphate phosphatase